MLIHFILIRLIFTHLKRLAVREINEKHVVSIVRLVYYTLIANHMYKLVRYGIQLTIATSALERTIATSILERTLCSRLACK